MTRVMYFALAFMLWCSTCESWSIVPIHIGPRHLSLTRTHLYSRKPCQGLLLPKSKTRLSAGGASQQNKEELERLAQMTPEERAADRTLGKQILLGLCLLWATNFAVIEQIFEACPGLHPSLYSLIRFGIASVILLPTYATKLTETRLVKNAFTVGVCIFAGYIGQALGLANGSTPEKVSFIASLVVVYVPLLQGFIKRDFSDTVWSSVLLALIGIAALELGGSSQPSLGDLYALGQPVGFGTSYILLEKVLKGGEASLFNEDESKLMEPENLIPPDPAAVTGLRILFITLASAGWALASGQDVSKVQEVLRNPLAMDDIIYTGVISTAFGIFLQTLGSSKVKATDVSIIFAAEPVFATAFSVFYLGSMCSTQDVLGGGLVLVACVANEYDFVGRRWRG